MQNVVETPRLQSRKSNKHARITVRPVKSERKAVVSEPVAEVEKEKVLGGVVVEEQGVKAAAGEEKVERRASKRERKEAGKKKCDCNKK